MTLTPKAPSVPHKAGLEAGDFFRCHNGPKSWQFGRCRQHDNEWLAVYFFGPNIIHPDHGAGWYGSGHSVAYPLDLARKDADAFLAVTEVWP